MKRLHGSLLINGVKESDTGQYYCEIESDKDVPISVSHRLELVKSPKIHGESMGNVSVLIPEKKWSHIKGKDI